MKAGRSMLHMVRAKKASSGVWGIERWGRERRKCRNTEYPKLLLECCTQSIDADREKAMRTFMSR